MGGPRARIVIGPAPVGRLGLSYLESFAVINVKLFVAEVVITRHGLRHLELPVLFVVHAMFHVVDGVQTDPHELSLELAQHAAIGKGEGRGGEGRGVDEGEWRVAGGGQKVNGTSQVVGRRHSAERGGRIGRVGVLGR